MRPYWSLTLICLLAFSTGLALNLAVAYAQGGTPAPSRLPGEEDSVLRQLLEEVRQLRLALQHATFANTRFQMAIERMRIQQEHVNEIHRELDRVRREISNLETAHSNAAERVKDWEERSKLAAGEELEALEQELRQGRSAAASIEREMQAQRAREADLVIRLEVERRRLGELNDRLDSLSEEMEKRR